MSVMELYDLLLMVSGVSVVLANNLRKERSVSVGYSSLSHLCEAQPDRFLCINCKTLVVCVKGQAFVRHCIEDHYCTDKSEFGGGVCYPNEPTECTCERPYIFRVDHYDPQRFFSCSDVGSKPESYKCPDGMVFDENLTQCRNEAGLPPCTKPGTFVNPGNCSEYYSCIALRHGWLQKSFLCNGNAFFNERKQICEDPCKYKFKCDSEGRFPDPVNKHRYFECFLESGQLKQIRYQCPEGYTWYSVSTGVGKCVESYGISHDNHNFDHCSLPQDWCPSNEIGPTVRGKAKDFRPEYEGDNVKSESASQDLNIIWVSKSKK
ncbi:uncharacterized protein LOC119590120 isoform X2 [Penaeus monodon]|uniref:uncharacterized protein LOC119590120 isoform X2 n=1 Tax=Penaeus monodon TaxID=6687 RepID=UPI0018A75D29|nr:uncharacterized protein LOC119590120 isoform X2 [Penaeus monodon]